MDDGSCGGLLQSWKFLREYTSTNDMKDYGLKVDEEVEAMQKVLAPAIREIEVYDKYLDKLYKQTDRPRLIRPGMT